MAEEKKYNLSVTPMWNTRNGNLMGFEIGPEQYDALQRLEKGGKLMVRFLRPDQRKNDRSPDAYLEYLTASEVERYKNTKEAPAAAPKEEAKKPDTDI